MERDPNHPIVDRPWDYAINAVHYHVGLDGTEPYLDLILQRNHVTRRLRFWSPRQLKIEEGFPNPTHGMEILDVRHRGLHGLGIRVGDFEAGRGSITFWARAVVDLDAQQAC
jgi:hypothetical protein